MSAHPRKLKLGDTLSLKRLSEMAEWAHVLIQIKFKTALFTKKDFLLVVIRDTEANYVSNPLAEYLTDSTCDVLLEHLVHSNVLSADLKDYPDTLYRLIKPVRADTINGNLTILNGLL